MDKVKLPPCPIPWCAKSKPELMQGGFRNGSYIVRCKTCGCETLRFYDPRFAISKWNTRAIEATRPTLVTDEIPASLKGCNPRMYRGFVITHEDDGPWRVYSGEQQRGWAQTLEECHEMIDKSLATLGTDELVERLCALHEKMLNAVKRARPYPVSIRMGQSDLDTILGAAVALERAKAAAMPAIPPQSLGESLGASADADRATHERGQSSVSPPFGFDPA